jgi:hypothetical protein
MPKDRDSHFRCNEIDHEDFSSGSISAKYEDEESMTRTRFGEFKESEDEVIVKITS